jgi:hypothetical protein
MPSLYLILLLKCIINRNIQSGNLTIMLILELSMILNISIRLNNQADPFVIFCRSLWYLDKWRSIIMYHPYPSTYLYIEVYLQQVNKVYIKSTVVT